MTILGEIIGSKKEYVRRMKSERPVSRLRGLRSLSERCVPLAAALKSKASSGIIAEFKRRSPSRSDINLSADVRSVVSGYATAGASAISVLTDRLYFAGSDEDFSVARGAVSLPLLRKEFIVDEYQVIETRAMGADVILLIAAVLSAKEMKQLSATAKSVGLEVLAEIHDEGELKKCLLSTVDIIGVNNRNLRTFEVNTELSFTLADKIPSEFAKISESGISSAETVLKLRKQGYSGFLIGETFMKCEDPGAACGAFIRNIEETDRLKRSGG